jgi:predicted ATPase
VVTGPNGSGKSNLYRALHLLVAASRGDLAQKLLEEGGMPSAMWAGDRHRGAVRVTVGATMEDYSYELSLGLSPDALHPPTPFGLDPDVKSERCWFGATANRHTTLLDRSGAAATAIDVDGSRIQYPHRIATSETVLGHLAEPARFPELFGIRRQLLGWRFYHHFDTGPGAQMRSAASGVRTHVLSASGDDLGAALLTIIDMGNGDSIAEAVERAFPDARLVVDYDRGVVTLGVETPGVNRSMAASELSDGTLRYLALAAALLSPRPPSLMILNEPETSLHPDLIPPLGQLIIDAAERCQVWVTTHSQQLAAVLANAVISRAFELRLSGGETIASAL